MSTFKVHLWRKIEVIFWIHVLQDIAYWLIVMDLPIAKSQNYKARQKSLSSSWAGEAGVRVLLRTVDF